jgi:NAD(P)H-hydrate epimerase
LIVAGSRGFAGAAVLAAKACLRSGVGKLTVLSTDSNREIIQTAIPEAMFYDFKTCNQTSRYTFFDRLSDFSRHFDAVGIGPGLQPAHNTKFITEIYELMQLVGTPKDRETIAADINQDLITDIDTEIANFVCNFAVLDDMLPKIFDADAINILAKNSERLTDYGSECQNKIFGGRSTIVTPHPAEFARLYGEFSDSWTKIQFMRTKPETIVLKGGVTYISANLADDKAGKNIYFNIGLNSGMATAGSGDVLTGIITSLFAQGYSNEEAAILGVWLHTQAGETARARFGETAMTAMDIVNCL